MNHPSVKKEWLGDGETSGEIEQLSWYIQERELEEQLKSHAGRQRSSAAECMGPGWVPQNKERRVQTCTQERQSPAGSHRMPCRRPAITQLTVLGKMCKWSGEDKAQQLTVVLRGEAQMVLLNLAEEEMGNYHTLVATLQRQFGNTGEPELLWARFRRRARTAGESLA
ncbi:UNVERIFIED_CONTAM: hypothetical protein FKN15_024029 [Acipenser sinensis]